MDRITPEGKINHDNPPGTLTLGSRLDTCFEKIAQAAKAAPKLPDVEAAAAGYEAALKKLEPLLVAANRYYTQKDWKDDHFAKGEEMHTQLVAAYDGFSDARGKLHDVIDKHNDEMLARSLARIEKAEGKSLHYYSRRVMNDGNALIDLAMDPAT